MVSSSIANETITTSDLDFALVANTFWRLDGNTGTTPGAQFLGTTDNHPLEFKVNGQRALRLELNFTSPNVIGGHSANWVAPAIIGATIGGGGSQGGYSNRVAAHHSTIGGGKRNNVASGAEVSVIAGGSDNAVGTNSISSAIGGGDDNGIAPYSEAATIAGGYSNDIGTNCDYSAIGGGYDNNIADNSGYATIAGGTSLGTIAIWPAPCCWKEMSGIMPP